MTVVFFILLIIQLGASVTFLLSLAKLNLLQVWQLLVVAAVVVLLFAINFCLLVVRKKGKIAKAFAVLLSIAVIVGSFFGIKYVRQATSFIETATGAEYETQTYKVLSLKSSAYTEVSMLARQHVGFLKSNPNLDNTHAALKNVVDYKNYDYDDLVSLVAALYDHDAAAVVLNDSYLDYLSEDTDSTFVDDTRVIYEFEVRADTPDLRQAVDVTTEPFAVYLSGSDSRGAITQTARSDVNIVAVVNPKTARILLISIPRDYYVQLHGTTGNKDKLTHAGIYGIEMSKNTIEDLLGIKINYTVKVGFQTVIKVVDALGGIDIDSDQQLRLQGGKCVFNEGLNKDVNSTCALAFARERYSYASGDRHRGQNQQQIIEKIIAKMSDPHYAVRWSQILDAAKGSFETSMTYDEITSFARVELASLRHWSVESIQLDGSGAMLPTYSMGSQKLYVMIPDQATVDAAKAKILEYTTSSGSGSSGSGSSDSGSNSASTSGANK